MENQLPDTHETRLLTERYERERLLREAAVRKMVEMYSIPAFDLSKSNTGTHLFEDGKGNHYDARDIAEAVVQGFMADGRLPAES